MHQNPKITWEVKGHLKIAFAQMIAGHKGIFYEIIYTNIIDQCHNKYFAYHKYVANATESRNL